MKTKGKTIDLVIEQVGKFDMDAGRKGCKGCILSELKCASVAVSGECKSGMYWRIKK